MSNRTHLIATDLCKQFGSEEKPLKVFQGLTLEVNRGEFCCIVGPSGCGKSTLLRILAGLDQATSGELSTDTSPDTKSKIGMVFQEHALFPWMTVYANLRFIIENNIGEISGNADAICRDYLKKIGLTDFARHYPHELSGGMRQRVSIARSFITNPDLLLMDEPFVFLDFQTRMRLHDFLLDIWQESKKTIVFVTHDIEEAVFLADKIIVLSRRPAMIKNRYSVDIQRPRQFLDIKKNPGYLDLVEKITRSIQEEMPEY